MLFSPRCLRMTVLLVLCVCSFLSCTSGGGDDDQMASEPIVSGTGNERSFTTMCGTVVNGGVSNPVQEVSGEPVVVVRAAAANALVIQRGIGNQLLKLTGLADGVSDFQTGRAIEFLNSLTGPAILYRADGDCVETITGGGEGIAGALFRQSDGLSFAEGLLSRGLAESSGTSRCGASQIRACYEALAEDNRIETGALVSNFLWKPSAERDGNLVVLFNPGGSTVVVNGETLFNSGASNGRGTTARGNRNGCGYGEAPQISATDSAGRALIWPNGELTFTIPGGCNRFEF